MCIIDAIVLFMITDKGTIGGTFIKKKRKRRTFATRFTVVKTADVVCSRSRFDKFICCDNALPSFTRNLRLWSPRQADMKDDVEIFIVSDERFAYDRSRSMFPTPSE